LNDSDAYSAKGVPSDHNRKPEQLPSEMNQGRASVIKRLYEMETRVLAAIQNWAQSDLLRIMKIEENLAETCGQISTIEDRLLKVEKRLDLPPAA
jgi:hypothetical protein